MAEAARSLCAILNEPSITYTHSKDLSFVNRTVLRVNANTYCFNTLIRETLLRLNIGECTFERTIEGPMLVSFLAEFQHHLALPEERRSEVFRSSSGGFTIAPVKRQREILWGVTSDPKENAVNICALLYLYVDRIVDQVDQDQKKPTKGVKRFLQQVVDACAGQEHLWLSLLFLDSYRGQTTDQVVKSAILTIILARAAGLDRNHQADLGYVAIYYNLFNGKLRSALGQAEGHVERLLARRNPLFSALDYLMPFFSLPDDWARRAISLFERYHRFDGEPIHGLPGYRFRWPPHLYTQIVALTSEFVALVSDPTRAMLPDEALRLFHQQAGTLYNPALVKLLVNHIGIYPIGSMVRLASDHLGVVIGQTDQSLLTPRVKVFFSIKSNARITPELLDMSKSACKDKILSHEDPAKWDIQDTQALWSGMAVAPW